MLSSEKFLRSQDVIFEMMAARKYDVSKIKKVTYSDDEENMSIHFDDTLVVWHLHSGVDADDLKKLFKVLNDEENLANVIFIKHGKCTSVANTTLTSSKIFNIQLFDIEEVLNNVTKHKLVPKHELLLNPDELLQKYGVSRKQMPFIPSSDPVVKFHGWKRGAIIQITRTDRDITFRCVV